MRLILIGTSRREQAPHKARKIAASQRFDAPILRVARLYPEDADVGVRLLSPRYGLITLGQIVGAEHAATRANCARVNAQVIQALAELETEDIFLDVMSTHWESLKGYTFGVPLTVASGTPEDRRDQLLRWLER